MRNSKYLQILGICTLFSVTACSSKLEIPEPPVYNKVRNISVDLNQEMQTIDGFGASDAWRCQMVGKYWPEEKRNQIADWLFSQEVDENGNPKGIGLSMWRFYIVREAQNKGLIATLRMSGDGLNAFYQLMVLTIGINMKDRDGF